MQALVDIVRSGKALYAGISNYPADKQVECYRYLAEAHVPCVLSQYKANMLFTETLEQNLPLAQQHGSGFICYSPLAQGILTDRYLNGIPEGSRAARPGGYVQREQITDELMARVRQLNDEAKEQGLTLAQYALRYLLRQEGVTSVIIGASSVEQLNKNLQTISNL